MARRVAILAPNYHPRTCGVGDHAMRVGEELRARGVQVRVFAPPPVGVHEEAPSLEARAIEGGGRARRCLSAYRAVTAFGADAVLVEYVPHMFGSMRTGSAGVPALARALRRGGRRVVVLAHELYTDWRAAPHRAWQALSLRAQLALVVAAADRVFVTTERRLEATRRLARAAGLDPHRIGFVPIGPNALPRAARPRRAGVFRVGLFSTLDRGKRIDLAVDAFATVKQRVPHAELVLLGDWGDDATELRAVIAAHPFRASIRVSGRLTLSAAAEGIADLDAFLFTRDTGASTRSGVLPIALGSGVPVIAFRGADTGPSFERDRNVVFASTFDAAGFATATLRVAEDAELARRVAAGGLALYEGHLRWPAIVDALFDAGSAARRRDSEQGDATEEQLRRA